MWIFCSADFVEPYYRPSELSQHNRRRHTQTVTTTTTRRFDQHRNLLSETTERHISDPEPRQTRPIDALFDRSMADLGAGNHAPRDNRRIVGVSYHSYETSAPQQTVPIIVRVSYRPYETPAPQQTDFIPEEVIEESLAAFRKPKNVLTLEELKKQLTKDPKRAFDENNPYEDEEVHLAGNVMNGFDHDSVERKLEKTKAFLIEIFGEERGMAIYTKGLLLDD